MKRALLVALLLVSLLAGCTTEERDGDGLDAQAEANGWQIQVEHADGSTRKEVVTSDPTKLDTDGDGLNDFREFQEGSDPRNMDTDGDRLLDGPVLCPDDGSELEGKILALEIIEHPEREGCYLGESGFEIDGLSIKTNPANANTDSNPTISDGLLDGEEIEGWEVQVGPERYHVWSNPTQTATDTDSDGIHDGREKELGTDPNKKDTDGDGEGDATDAAPLGNLVLEFTLESINLQSNYQITGGARLAVDVNVAGLTGTIGPVRIQEGNNRLDRTLQLDVPDTATTFDEDGAGAQRWTNPLVMRFFHRDSGNEEPIEVRQGENGHQVTIQVDAFAETWTGDTSDGSSSGPDASIRFDVTHRVTAP